MLKKAQNKILYQLQFLKSIGYEYHESVNFQNSINDDVTLPNEITDLEDIVKNCHLCNLSKYRENVLFGYGNIDSKILFLKESPSASEDELGQFYVGRSGELLKNMIQNVLNVSVEEIYITNVLKCNSSNTTISKEHVNYCKSYLLKQLEIIKPKLIVILGETAYTYFTNDVKNFNEVRGKVINYNDLDIICTYEPSFLLRNPSSKAEAFKDMLQVKSIMEQM